jgi:hypothetical protein
MESCATPPVKLTAEWRDDPVGAMHVLHELAQQHADVHYQLETRPDNGAHFDFVVWGGAARIACGRAALFQGQVAFARRFGDGILYRRALCAIVAAGVRAGVLDVPIPPEPPPHPDDTAPPFADPAAAVNRMVDDLRGAPVDVVLETMRQLLIACRTNKRSADALVWRRHEMTMLVSAATRRALTLLLIVELHTVARALDEALAQHGWHDPVFTPSDDAINQLTELCNRQDGGFWCECLRLTRLLRVSTETE